MYTDSRIPACQVALRCSSSCSTGSPARVDSLGWLAPLWVNSNMSKTMDIRQWWERLEGLPMSRINRTNKWRKKWWLFLDRGTCVSCGTSSPSTIGSSSAHFKKAGSIMMWAFAMGGKGGWTAMGYFHVCCWAKNGKACCLRGLQVQANVSDQGVETLEKK